MIAITIFARDKWKLVPHNNGVPALAYKYWFDAARIINTITNLNIMIPILCKMENTSLAQTTLAGALRVSQCGVARSGAFAQC